jgi:predicted PurR-regulated permease PerM
MTLRAARSPGSRTASHLGPPTECLVGLARTSRIGFYWYSAAGKPDQLRQNLLQLIKPVRDFIFAFTAGIGRGVLDFALALLIAGLLYVWGEDLGTALRRIADRLGGASGLRLVQVVESTVRGVFKAVIGTAAIEGSLAIFGFWVAGVPNALMLGMATFFISVIPGGPTFLWLPAALWLYANGHTGKAIFMLLWGAGPVGSSSNLILPLLIGKGVETPAAAVFLGVLGGILASGFLGLFIGPTMLAFAYNLLQDWMVGLSSAKITNAA